MARIIAVTNQKGGVGKTTTSNALITGLYNAKKKVLGVDLDPQGNLGFSMGVNIEDSVSVYDMLKGRLPVKECIIPTSCGDVIPSNILLSAAELEFNRPGREFLLKEALKPVLDDYDYIIIDTPPALNILTINAYTASNSLIIPMVPEILSLLGISQLKETVDSVKQFYNPDLHVMGILLNKFQKRINLAREVEEMAIQIAQQFDTVVLDVKIRNSVAVAESPAHGMGVLEYSPYCNASLDFKSLVDLIVANKL